MNNWTQTHTGMKFDIFSPTAESLRIEDIAHALSNKCRFNGHTKEFYSVAQHSLLVYDYVANKTNSITARLNALMHDCGEAYLPDIAAPIKPCFHLYHKEEERVYSFKEVENNIRRAVMKILCGMPDSFEDYRQELVDNGDIYTLFWEKRDVLNVNDIQWPNEPEWLKLPVNVFIEPVSPSTAKGNFLDAFAKLVAAV